MSDPDAPGDSAKTAPAVPGPRRGPRIAVLGDLPDAEEWVRLLAPRASELLRPANTDGLLRDRPDLAVVATHSAGALATVAALADAGADQVAVLLLIGQGTRPHPATQLVSTLMSAKQEWETTFDALQDPVVIVDAAGAVARCNRAFADRLGQELPTLIGQPLTSLLGNPPRQDDPIARARSEGKLHTGEASYPRLPGPWLVSASPLEAAAGGGGVLVILNDVSRIEERQERLLQAARLADVGQLAGGIAHEINTPLASIALRAESLERAAQDERLRAIDSFKNFPRYLKTIQEETFRCKRILGSLLEFARSRAPEIGPTDLNGVCDVAADLLAHELKVRHLTLEKRLDPGLPRIEADEARITQVLVALLLNAFDASKRGGLIVIETGRPTARQVSLSVCDAGHGIDPEHRGRLFTPFFTTRPPGGGAGLGLAISHGVVAAHGGSIQVESTPGEGARFTVVLPLKPGAPDDVAGAASGAKP